MKFPIIPKENHSEALRLPLWKNVLEEMIETATHGQNFDASYFEERLKCVRDSMEFGIAVSHIRKGLEYLGMYLSGRGLRGDQFMILLPKDNIQIAKLNQIRAMRTLSRTVRLLTATPVETLTESERRSLEKELSKASFRLALMRKRTPELKGEEAPKIS